MITTGTEDKRELLAQLLLEKHRRFFPTLNLINYFNYGAQGLIATPAVTAIQDYFAGLQADAPFSVDNALRVRAIMNRSRELLARECGTRPGNIALTDNTSMACNLAMWGLDWQAGDHLLLSDHEYPGVVAAAHSLAAHFDLNITTFSMVTDGNPPLSNLKSQLRPETRLVVLSQVLWNTGTLIPLDEAAELCHQGGALLLVDGAQSFGCLPLELDRSGVDFFAFTTHKWLCGPEGLGGLFFSDAAATRLTPRFCGWRGLQLNADNCPTGAWTDGRRFEVGTTATALYAGLNATLELHQSWGNPKRRFERILQLATQLWQGLRELAETAPGIEPGSVQPASGLVFLHCHQATRLATDLELENFMVRTIPGSDLIRISTHYLTREKDVQELIHQIGRAQLKITMGTPQ